MATLQTYSPNPAITTPATPATPASTVAASDPNGDYKNELDQIEQMKRARNQYAGDPNAANDILAKLDQQIADREATARRKFYDATGERFEAAPQSDTTKARALQLGDVRTREIDQGLAGAERSIASGYSRRGIGGSGYAIDAQGQALQAAAEERARARAGALDQAVAEAQRGIAGGASLASKGDPFLMNQVSFAEQNYQNMLMQEAADRAAYQKFLAKLGGEAAGTARDYIQTKWE